MKVPSKRSAGNGGAEMGAALTTLFGRDFLVGFFVPGLIFVLGVFALAWSSPELHETPIEVVKSAMDSLAIDKTEAKLEVLPVLQNLSIAILIAAWLLGLVLYSANLMIFRILEGYGSFNPLRLLIGLQRWRFGRLQTRVARLNAKRAQLTKAGANGASDTRRAGGTDQEGGDAKSCAAHLKALSDLNDQYAASLRTLVEEYPDDERHILPTRFGNAVRSAEVYPRVMYGIEGIQGYTRLLAVVPKEYYAFVATARVQIDLYLNLTIVALSLLIVHLCVVLTAGPMSVHAYRNVGISVALVLGSWLSMRGARVAALAWGEWVRACFDVFQGALRRKLNFDPFDTMKRERSLWERFSEAVVYRTPKSMIHRRRAKEGSRPPPDLQQLASSLGEWQLYAIRTVASAHADVAEAKPSDEDEGEPIEDDDDEDTEEAKPHAP